MNKPSRIKDNPSISNISNQIDKLNNIYKLSPIIQLILTPAVNSVQLNLGDFSYAA